MVSEQRHGGAASLRRGGWGQRGTAAATIAARLTLEQVCHYYGTTPAVVDFSLDVAPGEIICLLGQSGCGKTTLLRIAAGVERQRSGRVLINGSEVAGPTRFLPPEQRGVGLMFQDFALFPHLSILDNTAFGLTGLSRREAEHEARAALRRVGLESLAGEYPHALSGGEQQRVALARAVAPRPSVLLMDEPFSGLDRRLRENVRDETLALLRETRATCIIVTHDPEEAMQLADRIALMRRGRLVQVGPADELYRTPVDLFTARFFSEFNEIIGQVRDKCVTTPFGTVPANGFLEGEEIDVCIRPQGIRIETVPGGTAGRILRRRFLGDVDIIDIAVEGLDEPLKARVPGGACAGAGTEIWVHVDPQQILLFRRENGDATVG
ncbi:MAG: ABC transporter ATP-binding protein [Hyphomicrobiales bacterium]|nr:ABC transporter ATP-binding protein [Hyphomicrobiales bacterium]